MTVLSTTNRTTYTGNGTTTTFPVGFYFIDNSHVTVTVSGVTMTEGVQYILTGATDMNGAGTVTFTPAPAAGAAIVITRNVPVLQYTDYVPYDPFPANTTEMALDWLTMICQQITNSLASYVKLPDGVSGQFPDPIPYDLIGWNAAGDGLTNYDPWTTWVCDQFTGDGSTTTFTLTQNPGQPEACDVALAGVQLDLGSQYTVSVPTDVGQPGVITLTTPPPTGAVLQVRYGQAFASISQSILDAAQLASSSAAQAIQAANNAAASATAAANSATASANSATQSAASAAAAAQSAQDAANTAASIVAPTSGGAWCRGAITTEGSVSSGDNSWHQADITGQVTGQTSWVDTASKAIIVPSAGTYLVNFYALTAITVGGDGANLGANVYLEIRQNGTPVGGCMNTRGISVTTLTNMQVDQNIATAVVSANAGDAITAHILAVASNSTTYIFRNMGSPDNVAGLYNFVTVAKI